MNGMTSFNMRSLPVMSGDGGIIKLPSTIDLKSSLSDEFGPPVKLDKANTIISNLTANMAQKRIEDSDEIRFLFRHSSPVITTEASTIRHEVHEHDEDHTNPKLKPDTKGDAGHANLNQEKEHVASAALRDNPISVHE